MNIVVFINISQHWRDLKTKSNLEGFWAWRKKILQCHLEVSSKVVHKGKDCKSLPGSRKPFLKGLRGCWESRGIPAYISSSSSKHTSVGPDRGTLLAFFCRDKTYARNHPCGITLWNWELGHLTTFLWNESIPRNTMIWEHLPVWVEVNYWAWITGRGVYTCDSGWSHRRSTEGVYFWVRGRYKILTKAHHEASLPAHGCK